MAKIIQIRIRRARRTRARLVGTSAVPRLSIFRSNKYLYAQLIDDQNGKTILSESTFAFKGGKKNKSQEAEMLGKSIGEKATKAGIKRAVFDRGSYRYHGRVKAVAEATRKAGLKM